MKIDENISNGGLNAYCWYVLTIYAILAISLLAKFIPKKVKNIEHV